MSSLLRPGGRAPTKTGTSTPPAHPPSVNVFENGVGPSSFTGASRVSVSSVAANSAVAAPLRVRGPLASRQPLAPTPRGSALGPSLASAAAVAAAAVVAEAETDGRASGSSTSGVRDVPSGARRTPQKNGASRRTPRTKSPLPDSSPVRGSVAPVTPTNGPVSSSCLRTPEGSCRSTSSSKQPSYAMATASVSSRRGLTASAGSGVVRGGSKESVGTPVPGRQGSHRSPLTPQSARASSPTARPLQTSVDRNRRGGGGLGVAPATASSTSSGRGGPRRGVSPASSPRAPSSVSPGPRGSAISSQLVPALPGMSTKTVIAHCPAAPAPASAPSLSTLVESGPSFSSNQDATGAVVSTCTSTTSRFIAVESTASGAPSETASSQAAIEPAAVHAVSTATLAASPAAFMALVSAALGAPGAAEFTAAESSVLAAVPTKEPGAVPREFTVQTSVAYPTKTRSDPAVLPGSVASNACTTTLAIPARAAPRAMPGTQIVAFGSNGVSPAAGVAEVRQQVDAICLAIGQQLESWARLELSITQFASEARSEGSGKDLSLLSPAVGNISEALICKVQAHSAGLIALTEQAAMDDAALTCVRC